MEDREVYKVKDTVMEIVGEVMDMVITKEVATITKEVTITKETLVGRLTMVEVVSKPKLFGVEAYPAYASSRLFLFFSQPFDKFIDEFFNRSIDSRAAVKKKKEEFLKTC